MSTRLDWGKLKTQGRCKDIGVPWNKEESKAVFELGIPGEYVRVGVLDKEQYKAMKEKEKETGIVPLILKPRQELYDMALKRKLEFTEEVTNESLAKLIEEYDEKEAKKKEKESKESITVKGQKKPKKK